MVSMSRQRGAVHILFLIVVLVLALAGWGLWFAKAQEADDHLQEAKRATQQMEIFRARSQFNAKAYEVAAQLAGKKFPATCPTPDGRAVIGAAAEEALKPYVDAYKRDLSGLKDQIDAPGINPETLRAAWDPCINRYNALKTETQNLKLEISRLKTESSEKDTQISQVNAAKAKDRRDQEEKSAAALDNLQNQRADLQKQNDQYSERNRELTDQIRQTADKANHEVQKALRAKRGLEGQVRQVKSRLTIARATEKPDGKVIASDPALGVVYIDKGAKQILRAGTRFKVYETGKGGTKIFKGYIRVTKVDPEMSECRVDEETPGTGGIGAGDWIYNPYYSPNKSHHFFFLGEIPGSWDRTTVESLLRSRGVTIDKKVTTATDFLVLGVNEEEDAEPLTDNPNYRTALQYGIEIIRPRDLVPYLKF